MQLATAIHTLEASLGQLEAAVQRRLDLDKRRGDFETELAIMQDDRARLATELDGALTRLKSVESAAEDAVARLDRAMGVIQGLAGEGR